MRLLTDLHILLTFNQQPQEMIWNPLFGTMLYPASWSIPVIDQTQTIGTFPLSAPVTQKRQSSGALFHLSYPSEGAGMYEHYRRHSYVPETVLPPPMYHTPGE